MLACSLNLPLCLVQLRPEALEGDGPALAYPGHAALVRVSQGAAANVVAVWRVCGSHGRKSHTAPTSDGSLCSWADRAASWSDIGSARRSFVGSALVAACKYCVYSLTSHCSSLRSACLQLAG